ncbi:MAG: hypothetical protein AB1898_03635 [Acidobacteriota bacterium]
MVTKTPDGKLFPSRHRCGLCFLTLAGLLVTGWNSGAVAQPANQQPQTESKEMEIPKAPKDDMTVQLYKRLDEKQESKLTLKDKYKVNDSESDVEVVVTYFNWSLGSDDFWNRQISFDTKNKDGFIIEKIVKSGFGDLGYVKSGDEKTLDVFKKEKITVSGDVATAAMIDHEIGAAEKARYRHLVEMVLARK